MSIPLLNTSVATRIRVCFERNRLNASSLSCCSRSEETPSAAILCLRSDCKMVFTFFFGRTKNQDALVIWLISYQSGVQVGFDGH